MVQERLAIALAQHEDAARIRDRQRLAEVERTEEPVQAVRLVTRPPLVVQELALGARAPGRDPEGPTSAPFRTKLRVL